MDNTFPAPPGLPPRLRRRQAGVRGFTMVELIMVIVIIGVLAVVAAPRMGIATSMRNVGWQQQVLGALREAHGLAQAHRRLVCVDVAAQAVTITIAAANGAAACTQPWRGPDNSLQFAHDTGAPTTSVAPAGTLYFQPSGRITSDGAGADAVTATVTVTGESNISVVGETGHLE